MWAKDQLVDRDKQSILRDSRDYALLNGLVLRYAHFSNDNSIAHIPFTLFPSPFPKRLYQECLDIQPILNTLLLKIANDIEYIEDNLCSIAQVDDFTRNLLKVNKIVQKEGVSQPLISCINRADYMLDKPNDGDLRKLSVRQVEINAIASSMSAHSFNTQAMHEFIMNKYRIQTQNKAFCSSPMNNSLELVTESLIEAFDSYGKLDSYILMVNEERSLNFSDQVLIELNISKRRPDIRIVRRRFIDLPDIAKLGPNKELIVDDNKEVGLVYFRYCYDPTNYNFSAAWDTRLLIERSQAIKCPSINFHLAGAKKFQQALNTPEQLERYLNPASAKKLSDVFCKFWSLEPDTPEGEEGMKVGTNKSRKLVLKPQREGGGHNIFGQDIPPFLEQLANTEQLTQYILMEYIDSPQEANWLLMQEDDDPSDYSRLDTCDRLASELGIFGSILANGSEIKSNRSAGYLVRSKRHGVNEGGVAIGCAGISSLVLIDDDKPDLDLSSFYVD